MAALLSANQNALQRNSVECLLLNRVHFLHAIVGRDVDVLHLPRLHYIQPPTPHTITHKNKCTSHLEKTLGHNHNYTDRVLNRL